MAPTRLGLQGRDRRGTRRFGTLAAQRNVATPGTAPIVPVMAAYRAPRGKTITCANWQIEAAYRMVQNNLDAEVAEDPERLIVYGGLGKAARNPEALQGILATLRRLRPEQTMLVQSLTRRMSIITERIRPGR
jgi:hypothetical protein